MKKKSKHPGVVAIAKAVKQEWRRVKKGEFKNATFEMPIASIYCDCGTTHFIYPDMIRKFTSKGKLTVSNPLKAAVNRAIKAASGYTKKGEDAILAANREIDDTLKRKGKKK